MSEYYAVVRQGNALAHYGVKGMKWGVRKNPQKDLYKYMKREMKSARKANKKAKRTAVNGVQNIAKKIPQKTVQDYVRARDQWNKAFDAKERLDERARINYQKTKKPLTKQQQADLWKKMDQLRQNEDRAAERYDKVLNRAKEDLLGKYAKKKIRMDSHNTVMKRDAGYTLEAALASRMPEKNPLGLSKAQKRLEKEWTQARDRADYTKGTKARKAADTQARNAFVKFYNSMPEGKRKRYHDRYLY